VRGQSGVLMQENRAYYERRAIQERIAAETASNDKAREAHRQMAEHYAAQANSEQAN
jgi:hypothetical protein